MAIYRRTATTGIVTSKEDKFRLIFLCISIIFMLLAIILIGLGIWFVVERTYIASVLDNELYAVAAILMFAIGCTLFVIIGIGVMGVYHRIPWLIVLYLVIVGLIEICVFVAVVLAIVFSAQFEELVRDAMKGTLLYRYGNNTNNITRNRIVTQAWDTMQIRLKCCAVEDEGWEIYRRSSWYQHKLHSGHDGASIAVIPTSCCKRLDRDWYKIINEDACLRPQAGPPRHKDSGSVNIFLTYQGCFETGQKYILDVVWIVLGFGLGLFVLVFVSIVSAVIVCLAIRKERKQSKRYQAGGGRQKSGSGSGNNLYNSNAKTKEDDAYGSSL